MRRIEHLEQWIPFAIMLIAFLVERSRRALAAAARRRREAGDQRQYEPIEPESPRTRLLDGAARLLKRLESGWHYVAVSIALAALLFFLTGRRGLPKELWLFIAALVGAAMVLRKTRSRTPDPRTDAPLSIRDVPSERRERA